MEEYKRLIKHWADFNRTTLDDEECPTQQELELFFFGDK